MPRPSSRSRAGRLLTLVGAAGLSLAMLAPALADNTVTTSVISSAASIRSARTTDFTLPAVTYSHTDQSQSGSLALIADDSSGTNAGWNVTVQASSFAYSGPNSGTAIPASNFSLTSASTPTKTSGQNVNATGGPMVPATSPVGTLDVARKVVQANAGFGKGTYTQTLGVSLVVPADSVIGTYTSTLTVTNTAGP